MATIAAVFLSVFQLALLFCLAYHFLMVLASIRQPEPAAVAATPGTRFAIAIPAHNEALVLPGTLARLQEQDYPGELVDIHVVADHCSDGSAEAVRQSGGRVHERSALPRGRKAYALQWLLDRILVEQPPYDAVAVFDADSQVEPDFLRTMDAHLTMGAQVLQGQHIIGNPHDSPLAAMAAVDMRLNNRLRNQSRRNLGFACRLMGDAMVFDVHVLNRVGWLGESLIEDREYGYQLLIRGLRALYVPQARSYGQAAGGWRQAKPQRLRWYQGVVDLQRRLAGPLISEALRQRSVAILDGALELLMPSFSLLWAASTLNLLTVLGFQAISLSADPILGISGSALLLAAWSLYPVAGLVADRAPPWAFRTLLLGPAYLLWRLWISVLVRKRGDRIAWIRTQRREEADRAGRCS